MTNFEKIKEMDIDGMTSFITLLQLNEIDIRSDGIAAEEDDVNEWLNKEYEGEF
jgi:hypothetical protein